MRTLKVIIVPTEEEGIKISDCSRGLSSIISTTMKSIS
jgi:hypothetical protein